MPEETREVCKEKHTQIHEAANRIEGAIEQLDEFIRKITRPESVPEESPALDCEDEPPCLARVLDNEPARLHGMSERLFNQIQDLNEILFGGMTAPVETKKKQGR